MYLMSGPHHKYERREYHFTLFQNYLRIFHKCYYAPTKEEFVRSQYTEQKKKKKNKYFFN